jgi:hypothetical protein
VTFSQTTRCFLTAALVHLSAVGCLLLLASRTEALTAQWNLTLWLLLIGFVVCTTFGLSFHLLPAVARRLSPKGPWAPISFVLVEASVVVGAASLAESSYSPFPGWTFSAASLLLLVAVGVTLGLFGATLARPRLTTPGPETRPGDAVTVPLFLASWVAAFVAAGLFALSGVSDGPGFGWWLAAVHLFVLGHVTLLIAAVTVRLVPRLLDADAPRTTGMALAALGVAGAGLVPLGMLLVSPSDAELLDGFAAPEAAFALLFLGILLYLGWKARTRRAQLGLHLTSVLFLLAGGAAGLWMVYASDYDPVVSHALVNLLGFIGLTIVVMWFGMVAPFQRISHAWTLRMLWVLSAVWLTGVVVLAWAGDATGAAPVWATMLGGALLLGVAVTWGAGTIPVLFPRINPLPGLSSEQIRVLRGRWGRR